MMENDDTFMRITNQDIYRKLLEIEEHVKLTNGKVKLSRWLATTALSFSIIVAGWFVTHLNSLGGK